VFFYWHKPLCHYPRPGLDVKPSSDAYRRIYAAVKRIPKGKVATYGQIALLAGMPRAARQVGYALHALPHGSRVPWQRVVNHRGRISLRSSGGHDQWQRVLLEEEGVEFDTADRIALSRFQWRPEAQRPVRIPSVNS
jgi:methylated-DNA-protein-cysteine methyltransferase related protein